MKMNESTRNAFSEVIQVDDYRLVAALSCAGFKMPRRQYAWISEEIAEDCLDFVVDNSVYIYPSTPQLRKAINYISKNGFSVDKLIWNWLMDEVKSEYGVGPSILESFESGRGDGQPKIISLD